jgi:large subunit ribosomal protein L17
MILHGEIKTTKAKALAVIPSLEKIITLVKKNDLAARRDALARLGNDRKTTDILFDKYASLANSRQSGFTKLTLLPNRRGDDAVMVKISWVELADDKKEETSKGKEKTEK